MTLIDYLYSNVAVNHVEFEIEIGARMAYCVGCKLRNRERNGLANCLRLITEESYGEVPSFRDTSWREAEVLLQGARRHL
jgi:hypothetical protein